MTYVFIVNILFTISWENITFDKEYTQETKIEIDGQRSHIK